VVEDEDDVFLLISPQNLIGASLMDNLEGMAKKAGDRPLILLNPQLRVGRVGMYSLGRGVWKSLDTGSRGVMTCGVRVSSCCVLSGSPELQQPHAGAIHAHTCRYTHAQSTCPFTLLRFSLLSTRWLTCLCVGVGVGVLGGAADPWAGGAPRVRQQL
jgi:hypothetical protein